MPIIFCPSCALKIDIPQAKVGRSIKCPGCDIRFEAALPAVESAPQETPAPAPLVPIADRQVLDCVLRIEKMVKFLHDMVIWQMSLAVGAILVAVLYRVLNGHW